MLLTTANIQQVTTQADCQGGILVVAQVADNQVGDNIISTS
jgi:hypothetical protein